MKIVLFHPRGFSSSPQAGRLHRLACTMPPLGLASIAAVLRQAGHDVAVFDAALLSSVSNDRWADRIVSRGPDFVGFSAITASFHDAYDVARLVKERNDRIATVFGGPHVSWGKGRILSRYPAVDFVIAGEGEYSLKMLVDGRKLNEIEGLYFRNGTAVEHGPQPGFCEMDDLPFPAYELLDGFPRKYRMPLFSYPRHPGANVISSRGCVYQCSYCDRSVFGRSFRFNSPEYTAALVARLAADFGVRHINFYDDLFTLNRERVERLCELLVKGRRRRRTSFNCIVRLGHIDDGLIRLLRSAGCFMVNVGIESGDQAILDKHKCGLTLDTIRRDVENIARGGLYVKGLFMMGFPGETRESIVKTRDFAMSLPLAAANVTAFTPFPGAPIAPDIAALGEFEDDWSKMDCEHFVFVPNEIGSTKILETQYKEFIKNFYQRRQMRPIYRAMLVRSPHSYVRLVKHGLTFFSYARKMNERDAPKDAS
jgi:anaerobic magnesium-protoporphyrin IX monomethyl ester cyclase